MKIPLIVFALVFCLNASVMNAQSLERQVIASAGSNSTNGFTIGEVIVSNENLEVTAGFQQGILSEDPPLGVEDITNKLTVFPVPTKDILTVQGEDFSALNTNATLFSVEGKRMKIKVESESNHLRIDLESLPSGNYFLKLDDAVNQKIANYKILKIN